VLKLSLRELRGLAIVALGGQIKRMDKGVFMVKSQSEMSIYHRVEWRDNKWICNCADYKRRNKPCKHIYAVNFLLDLPRILLSNSEAFERLCPNCGSADVGPKGFRYNKSGVVRMFKCRSCGKRFKDDASFGSSAAKAAIATIATDLYYKGLSIRDIQSHLWHVYGIDKPTATIHRWITKMTKALKKVFQDAKPDVGDKWLADETVVKVNGQAMYLWNVMDFETRYYIASLLTSGREAQDAMEAIKEAIKNTGKLPKTLVTDGLRSYTKAIELLGIKVNHISNVGLAKDQNNNRIERLHGTVKEWIKRKRGAKGKFKELINGYQIYYNNLRPNIALKDKTPTKSEEKWATLIFSAHKH
jgi:transposase-like protein